MNKYQDILDDLTMQKKMLNIALHEYHYDPFDKGEYYKLQGRIQQNEVDTQIVREKANTIKLNIVPHLLEDSFTIDIKPKTQFIVKRTKETYTLEEVYSMFNTFIEMIK